MDKDKKAALAEFSRKALQRLEDKKTVKTACLYVPSLDQEIKVRSLTRAEISECMGIDETNDPNRGDRYCVYIATVEPNLKLTATELKEAGEIVEYLEVVDIFDMHEVTDIGLKVMELSGVTGNKKVTVIDALKN